MPLAFLIAIGTVLLMLPAARAEPGSAGFVTALFCESILTLLLAAPAVDRREALLRMSHTALAYRKSVSLAVGEQR